MSKSEVNRWKKIKLHGSDHYKTDEVEPIDLYKSGGLLRSYAITSIIKYAFRNRPEVRQSMNIKDIDKLLHLGEMLRHLCLEEDTYKKKKKLEAINVRDKENSTT